MIYIALFGKSKEEEAQEVIMDIRTNNSWFAQGIPKTSIRNIPNGGNGKTFE